MRYCATPGCRRRTTRTHCDEHAPRRTGPAGIANHGYDGTWRDLRATVLASEPICRRCRNEWATNVDHIEPLRVAPARRLDMTNLQPLCDECAKRKNAEDAERWPHQRSEHSADNWRR